MMMNVWGMTDIGLVRKENQDAYAVRVNEESGHVICVVCDGMEVPRGESWPAPWPPIPSWPHAWEISARV